MQGCMAFTQRRVLSCDTQARSTRLTGRATTTTWSAARWLVRRSRTGISDRSSCTVTRSADELERAAPTQRSCASRVGCLMAFRLPHDAGRDAYEALPQLGRRCAPRLRQRLNPKPPRCCRRYLCQPFRSRRRAARGVPLHLRGIAHARHLPPQQRAIPEARRASRSKKLSCARCRIEPHWLAPKWAFPPTRGAHLCLTFAHRRRHVYAISDADWNAREGGWNAREGREGGWNARKGPSEGSFRVVRGCGIRRAALQLHYPRAMPAER